MKYILIIILLSSCANKVPHESALQSPPEELSIPSVPEVEVKQPEAKITQTLAITKYCHVVDDYFERYGWGKGQCEKMPWNHVRNSAKGTPLPWIVFGEEGQIEEKNVTLIFCGVHGDEVTPVKFCYDIIKDLMQKKIEMSDKLVVIAPLVNPDSFLKPRPTRINARGIDINRNFPTKNWKEKALNAWTHSSKKDPRRFPGLKPVSEPEVLFQMNLVKRYNPKKIISVHAPLTLLDYDGPETQENSPAAELLLTMSEKAAGYKVIDYPHFPGSLGTWAGQELSIPTYTLELPNINAKESDKFWGLFREAIHSAIQRSMAPMRSLPGPSATVLPAASEH